VQADAQQCQRVRLFCMAPSLKAPAAPAPPPQCAKLHQALLKAKQAYKDKAAQYDDVRRQCDALRAQVELQQRQQQQQQQDLGAARPAATAAAPLRQYQRSPSPLGRPPSPSKQQAVTLGSPTRSREQQARDQQVHAQQQQQQQQAGAEELSEEDAAQLIMKYISSSSLDAPASEAATLGRARALKLLEAMEQVLRRMRQDWDRLAAEHGVARAAAAKLGRAVRDAGRETRVRCSALQEELGALQERPRRASAAAAEAVSAAAEHLSAVGELMASLVETCDHALHPPRPASRGAHGLSVPSSPAASSKPTVAVRAAQVRLKRMQRAVGWLAQLLSQSKLVVQGA
jgi:hypothetical protein